MLQFEANDGLEIYVSQTGRICFKSCGDLLHSEEQIVTLTIGQFRSVVKAADSLIEQANDARGKS